MGRADPAYASLLAPSLPRLIIRLVLGSSSTSISRPRQSPSAGRRRSQVLMNLQLADPSVPGPGEMIAESHMSTTADSHHARTPSLGELHQSLENEQEFQVNRLLQEIRRLQTQLAQRPAPQPHLHQLASTSGLAINEAADASVATSSSVPAPTPQPARSTTAPSTGTTPRSPGTVSHPRSSFDMARADLQQRRSRTPSRGASPKLRSTSFSTESGEPWILGGRDESAFYQAETQMLIRENQMLRHRIRELGKSVRKRTMGGLSC